jgi:hypothetical protein
MKDLVNRVKSFITFDFPLQPAHISARFNNIHSRYQAQFPHWSLEATRQKLISAYWYSGVLLHYATVVTLATVLASPFIADWRFFPGAAIVALTFSFLIMLFFTYRYFYLSHFLPGLEMIVNERQTALKQEEELKKCRRTQYSIPTLAVISCVERSMAGLPSLAPNDQSAVLLNTLYGVDKDKLKQNLSRIYQPAKLSAKERAEMFKALEQARAYFEAAGYIQASKALDLLERKLRHP